MVGNARPSQNVHQKLSLLPKDVGYEIPHQCIQVHHINIQTYVMS